MNRWTLSVVAALASVAIGCSVSNTEACHQYCSSPREQQHAAFRSYDLERQLEVIHVCRHTPECKGEGSNAPDHVLLEIVVERGEPAVSSLTEKLRAETDDAKVAELIQILRLMALKGHLRGKREVAYLVEQKARALGSGLVARSLEDSEGRRRRARWARDISEEVRRHVEW